MLALRSLGRFVSSSRAAPRRDHRKGAHSMDDDFGFWDVILSMFWFMLLIAWIWLLISILGDIFRDRELGGGAKALWTLFLIFIPWLGALIYLIVRGNSMNERTRQQAEANEARMRTYVRDAAGTPSMADELAKLKQLHEAGTLTDADYERAKTKVLA
jgi:hypothetical protein